MRGGTKARSLDELEELLSDLPETDNYGTSGSFISPNRDGFAEESRRKIKDGEASESDLLNSLREVSATHYHLSIRYSKPCKVHVRADVGPLPVESYTGEVDFENGPEIEEYLEEKDWK